VELRTECLTDRGREGHEFLRELGERVAQAVAQARSGEERAHMLGGAVEAIGEDPFDPVRRLPLDRRALERAVGWGQGRRTRLLGVAQRPEHTAADNRGQVRLVAETMRVCLLGQDIKRQRQPTPGLLRTFGDLGSL
jgi:hypothetical protein